MPSKNKTPFAALNLWEADDQPLRVDFNADNAATDAAFADAERALAAGRVTGESALLRHWYTARGKSFFHMPPAAARCFADNFSDGAYIDFRKTSAGINWVNSSYAPFQFNIKQGRPNLQNTGYSLYSQLFLTTFDLLHDATISTVEQPMYQSRNDVSTVKATMSLYRLDGNDMPVELVTEKVTTLAYTSGHNILRFTFNQTLPAGVYGFCCSNLTLTLTAGGTTTSGLNNANTSWVLGDYMRRYQFGGIGVKGAVSDVPLAPNVFFTYAPGVQYRVVTKSFDFGEPVRHISVYVQHSGLAGKLTVSATGNGGTRFELTRDPSYTPLDAGVERYHAAIPETNKVSLEFLMGGDAPADAAINGWFITVG